MRPIKEIFRSHAVLDASGRHVNGTDRQTNHNYSGAYESLFNFNPSSSGPNCDYCHCFTDSHTEDCKARRRLTRESVKLMMEVGNADGSGLLAWAEVFPNAKCIGIDIHPSDKAQRAAARIPDRFEFYLGDATRQEVCECAAAGREFDFIVDDATHRIEDVLLTLYWLWPYVRRGGLYVVEDGGFQDANRALGMFPFAEVVETQGPFGGVEPLVILRKPL